MSLVLYSARGCYPCDRAKTTLINAKLAFSVTQLDSKIEGIGYFPTLCMFDADFHEVGRLIGPSNITVENIRELANKYNIGVDKVGVI